MANVNQSEPSRSIPNSARDELATAHADAMLLLAMPPLPGHTASMLSAMPGEALRWLWSMDGGQATSTAVFADAAARIAVLAPPAKPMALAALLGCLGACWRALPTALLHHMLRAMPEGDPPTRLLALELQHVADWALHTDLSVACARWDWSELVTSAQAWRLHEELALRMHPRHWVHPLAPLSVSGFNLTPVVETAQLADATGPQLPLCSVATARQCESGDAAWWLVGSAFSRSGFSPLDAAIGLTKGKDGHWAKVMVLAPEHQVGLANGLADCLLLKAQTADRLAKVRGMAYDIRSAHDVKVAVVEALRGVVAASSQ